MANCKGERENFSQNMRKKEEIGFEWGINNEGCPFFPFGMIEWNFGKTVRKEAHSLSFPQNFLDELIARSDIVDVVGNYVHLTKKGSNLFGLCPFHSEKTGSFSVAPDKQIYYCFGCKKSAGMRCG